MRRRRAIATAITIAIVIGVAAVLVALAIWVADMRSEQRGRLIARHGTLVATTVDTADPAAAAPGGYLDETLSLAADTGLRVDLRVRWPDVAPGERVPVLLLLGGHRTGKDAVELAGVPDGVAYAAIDYPYDGSHRLRGVWQTLRAIPAIQQAFLDTPPALSLALDWLLAQPWADPARTELVGVSLGVPFAAAAGALDERFRRVWLIHGAGDNHAWLAHNLREDFPADWRRAVMTEFFYTLIYAESFRTARWVEAIPPRPAVIIAAREDERLPPEALAPLPAIAAREPAVDLLWTDGLHIEPDRPEVIRQLLDLVLVRVRQDPPPVAPAADPESRQPR
ncbi:alpha/beta hydrolase family protein [Lentisalinibacter orientalis]|uniref:alpha/beta hydrolase family protein n=1 Tax=Lentisalinibacter orientalis TaxID=2992241 RepID=UPI0038656454